MVEVGKIYTIAGCGELLVEEAPAPPAKTTITMINHGGIRVWVGVQEVLREATPEAIRLRHENARLRGLECKRNDCWCRPYVDTAETP